MQLLPLQHTSTLDTRDFKIGCLIVVLLFEILVELFKVVVVFSEMLSLARNQRWFAVLESMFEWVLVCFSGFCSFICLCCSCFAVLNLEEILNINNHNGNSWCCTAKKNDRN